MKTLLSSLPTERPARPVRQVWAGLLLVVAVGCWVAAAVCAFPRVFGIAQKQPLQGERVDGQLWEARIPAGLKGVVARELLPSDYPQVWEGTTPLWGARAGEEAIRQFGEGRFRVHAGRVQYSTSQPLAEGATPAQPFYYEASSWSVPESFLFFLLGSGVVFCGAGWGGLSARGKRRFLALATWSLLLGLAVWWWHHRAEAGPALFLSLWLPALWAAAVVLCFRQGRVTALALAVVLLLLPAWAMLWHYPWSGGSDGWFLFGGVFPVSDARHHFIQALELQHIGATLEPYNARMFYPLMAANLLALTGGHPLWAVFAQTVAVLLALGGLAWLAVQRLGLLGAWVFLLGSWFFYRTHGCGLWMTENTGLFFGAVGAACWVVAAEGQQDHRWRGLPRAFWWAWAGLFLLSWASASRPGALLVLPLLAGVAWWWGCVAHSAPAAAGWKTWLVDVRKATVAAGLLAAAMLLPFAANHLAFAFFYRGPEVPVGNFAFFLHGLLTDSNWQPSYVASGGDSRQAMAEVLRLLQEEPWRLLRGIGRAWEETRQGFLFRWGEESRLKLLFLVLTLAGGVGAWWTGLRSNHFRQAWWLTALAVGVLLSTPFATPWDAGSRGYAATYPALLWLTATGAAWLTQALLRAGRMAWLSLVARRHRGWPGGLLGSRNAASSPQCSLCPRTRLLFALVLLPVVILTPWFLLRTGGNLAKQAATAPAVVPGTVVVVAEPEHALPAGWEKYPRITPGQLRQQSQRMLWNGNGAAMELLVLPPPYIFAVEKGSWHYRILNPFHPSEEKVLRNHVFWVDASLLP